jgi:putative hydrolase of the HAD superfamily
VRQREREIVHGQAIELVLFDVGGVLIDLYSKQTEAVLKREYGLDSASYERIAKPAMERAVIGKTGTTELLQAFCAACERDVTMEKMKSNLQSMIGDERPAMLELVRKVSRRARVAAFTNTIELHWRLLQNRHRYRFPALMERIIASHHIGLAKPMRAAYQAAAQLLGLRLENILFVDDLPENVNGATDSGMLGILFEDYSSLRAALQELVLV